jgi:predicted nucleotidyltransferase/CRISPR/Cas system-associated endoribonuclease Cas2
MKLFELKIEYHDSLNPKLWEKGDKLNKKVKEKLMEISDAFIKFMEEDFKTNTKLTPVDIIITGSSANYNWTDSSDIDLHIVIDKAEFLKICPIFTDAFFTDKKTLWNEHHDITIYDLPVEVYVQDEKEKHIASGVYSLKNDKWVTKPTYNKPKYNGKDVEIKLEQFKREIDKIIEGEADFKTVLAMKKKIKRYRASGLDKKGEYSVENLVFKGLRKSGHLEKLAEYSKKVQSDDLSLE